MIGKSNIPQEGQASQAVFAFEQSVIPYIIPHFTGETIRMVEIDGVMWYVAKDICKQLEIKNVSDAVKYFTASCLTIVTNDSQTEILFHTTGRGRAQRLVCVNESGVYRLIMQSRKPEAEAFKTWLFNEVLPSIRKTGKYEVPEKRHITREESVLERKHITAAWKVHGHKAPIEYAVTTKVQYGAMGLGSDFKKALASPREIDFLHAVDNIETILLNDKEQPLGVDGCRTHVSRTAEKIKQILLEG